MNRTTRFQALVAALALLLLSACVSVKPLEEVEVDPDENRVLIHDTAVHIEQSGQGEPVLLIHGFGASAYTWRKVMPDLAERFHVVAFDLYGFGWTERP